MFIVPHQRGWRVAMKYTIRVDCTSVSKTAGVGYHANVHY